MPFLKSIKKGKHPLAPGRVRGGQNGLSSRRRFKAGDSAADLRGPGGRRRRQKAAADDDPTESLDEGGIPFVRPISELEIDTSRLEPGPSVWNGQIYVTPDEMISPMDCDLWPNSPFCNPLDAVDPGSFLDINFEVFSGECETVVTVTPTAAWLTMRPGVFSYRTCDPPDKSSPAPVQVEEGAVFLPYEVGSWPCIYLVSYQVQTDAVLGQRRYYTVFGPLRGFRVFSFVEDSEGGSSYVEVSALPIAHGDASFRRRFWEGPYYRSPEVTATFTGGVRYPIDQSGDFELVNIEVELYSPTMLPEVYRNNPDQIGWNQSQCPHDKPLLSPPPAFAPPGGDMSCNCKKIEADLEAIKKYLGVGKEPWNISCDFDDESKTAASLYEATQISLEDTCNLKGILGVKDAPWSLPKHLGNREEGTENFENYAELIKYFALQLSSMLGATGEIKVKVKDTNLTEEGNQEVELKFPNIAEAIGNLIGLALTNQTVNSATLNASMRGLVQAGQAFTSAAVAAEQIEAVMEMMGFQIDKKTIKVPLMYTPGETAPDKLLQESEVNVSYWEVVDKKNLQTHLLSYDQAASIVKAALVESVLSPTEFKERTEQAAAGLQVKASDFDSFLDRVERGFTDAAGNTETTPYGRPYDERPRVRKVDGRQDGADNT